MFKEIHKVFGLTVEEYVWLRMGLFIGILGVVNLILNDFVTLWAMSLGCFTTMTILVVLRKKTEKK